ncbi:glutathione S-transferase TCHQD3 [Trifolium repens]|nr:glutathione S-transferase TCHQD3 [Trifolium repens]
MVILFQILRTLSLVDFSFCVFNFLGSNIKMQLYHHPFDMDSQKVRLALEEKGIDYTSFHVNPVTGKNFDSTFFQMNPSGSLPVFQNGSHIIYKTIDIIQYIERIAVVSAGYEDISSSRSEVIAWMKKIQEWDPKYFSLSHIPEKYRVYVSKFIRRVVIARMSDAPELAGAYHRKLREAYQTEEKLKDPDVLRRTREHLGTLLDEAERQLSETPYLAGEEFTMADVMLIPILVRLKLLDLENEYITVRPNIAEYWVLIQQRPSYRKVIEVCLTGTSENHVREIKWCKLVVCLQKFFGLSTETINSAILLHCQKKRIGKFVCIQSITKFYAMCIFMLVMSDTSFVGIAAAETPYPFIKKDVTYQKINTKS